MLSTKEQYHFSTQLRRLCEQDTTACALSWTLYELSRHPEDVKKLRREILDIVGPVEAPTYGNLKQMKYLQNLINEILRLYPPGMSSTTHIYYIC